MSNEAFGVFFTCYTEKKAVENAILSLRNVYPSCPVYLVSDGGSDFSYLNEKFRNLKTKIEEDTRGISQRMTIEKLKMSGVKEKIFESVMVFLRRNLDAIEFCNTESILIMEPDVLIKGKLRHFPNEKNALLGSRVNHGTHPSFLMLGEKISKIPGSVPFTHYGSTPAFYHHSAMKRVWDFCNLNKDVLMDFIETEPSFVCYDVFLTALFAACGYEEVYNPDITQPQWNSKWETSEHPLIHGFRGFYPQKEDGYDGRHSFES